MADPDVPGNPPETPPPNGDWFDGLPPDLKVEKSLQSFKGKTVADVAKSYVEAQRLIGSSIRLPKADAPPEEQQKFYDDIYAKLGRPESPDKYEYARPQLPDGAPWDEASEKEFLAEAHKVGLNSKQASRIAAWWGGKLSAGMQAQAQQQRETETVLKTEWGSQYERKLTLAAQAAEEIGGKEYVALLEQKGIANHPLVVRAHAAYGETLAETKVITGDVPGQPTANEAQAKLSVIYADKGHPYHRGDPKAVDEVLQLTRMAMGAEGRKVVATMG